MDEFFEHYELIRNFLPKYLSPEQQDNLFKDIEKHFPYSTDADVIYSNLDDDLFFQGDGVNEMFSQF